MWYRLYLAKIPKEKYKEMLNLTFEEFFDKYWDKSRYKSSWEKTLNWLYEISEEIFCFWKYVDYSDWMKEVIFKDNELNERYSERSFHIADIEIIKNIIEDYSNNVAKFYKSLITWEQETTFFWIKLNKKNKTKEKNRRIYEHLHKRYYDFKWINFCKKKKKWYHIADWYKPYMVTKEWSFINSMEYEYQIFELIRIYREFDKEKDVLLYYWR